MSVRVMKLVWERFGGTGEATRKLVLLALADWGDDAGNRIYPGMGAIADKTCLSESQARRLVHSLIREGFIEVTANESGGAPGTTRNYRINLRRLIHTPSADATPTGGADANPTPSADVGEGLHRCTDRAGVGASQTIREPLGNREREARMPSAATALAPEWKPSPEAEARARKVRPDLDVNKVIAKFISHARSEGWQRYDWNEALHKWVLDERLGTGIAGQNVAANDKAWAPGAEPDRVIVYALLALGLDSWRSPETHGQARARVTAAGGEHLLRPEGLTDAFRRQGAA